MGKGAIYLKFDSCNKAANVLIVKADNNNQDNRKQLQYKIALQHDVVTESITSSLQDGILSITVPRIKSKPQTIIIN